MLLVFSAVAPPADAIAFIEYDVWLLSVLAFDFELRRDAPVLVIACACVALLAGRALTGHYVVTPGVMWETGRRLATFFC